MSLNKQSLVIVGAGSYARCIADAALATGEFTVQAFLEAGARPSLPIMGIQVLDEADYFAKFTTQAKVVLGVGDNWRRAQLAARIRTQSPNVEFATVIHPRAYVSATAELGEGTVLLAGAVVNPGAQIGAHTSIWTNATVEHDARLGLAVTFAPAATIGGNVKIGDRSFLGMGACVNHTRIVGADTVIGSNALVTKDVPSCVVAVGVPVRILGERQPGEPYL